ncbi:amidase signature enzyme [Chiua virens]|nr:amidase signature enzyme [Chiua virens]
MSAHEVPTAFPDLYEAGVAELQQGLEKGHFTSVDLVKAYLARVEEVNLKGAALHAVIETNPQALAQAAALDAERKAEGSRGPLHGIPLLLKDNIATLHEEGLNTTAGSYALLGSEVAGDAPVATKLREAGAIFLGKTNIPVFPYYPNGDPSGSSSGSGVAMAIGLAAASLGSETDGSIISPSSENNIVGIKPTIRAGLSYKVIPISSTQDTVGPMCRSVADAALLLSVIAGKDVNDEATKGQPEVVPDYTEALDKNALNGKRLGVPRKLINDDCPFQEDFSKALDILRSLGAEIVDPADFPNAEELKASQHERLVLTVEFKVGINKYIEGLRKRPQNIDNLADLIRYNNEHNDKELPEPYHTDQSQFYKSEASREDKEYYEAVKKDYQLGRTDGIDATLKNFALDAIILPSGYGYATKAAAIAGYPLVSVPLGFLPDSTEPTPNPPTPLHVKSPGMPGGFMFHGHSIQRVSINRLAYAFEQATHVRLERKAFAEAIPKTQLKDVVSPLTGKPVRLHRCTAIMVMYC